MRLFPLFVAAALAVAPVSSFADPNAYAESIHAWRQERVARLTAPDNWLSLIGLHWLTPGDNSVGSAADNTVQLAAGPAYLGTVRLDANGRVEFLAAPGSLAHVDGSAPADGAGVPLHYGRATSVVRAGSVSFIVIQRGEKIGLRVRDSESPRRAHFVGIDYFPIDPTWRIEAQWVPFEPAREIPITNVLGQTTPSKVPGKAVFTREGRTFEMLPVAESANETLFFILSDATSGEETYGAARFVYADPPRDGKVILDFNRAQNPPCAFTPFATCPLPPKENRLSIRVEAGEKNYRGESH